ncbi:MAG: flagellin N-terminal helical domain-containing protein [Alkalilacustris sp.]
MASILTNNGAMVALQTMRQINRGMETTQSQISTGLKVGSAKDNAATWAISKVMESDVAGFKAIKENLALGSSTVNVARNAAETTTKLLTEIKEKIVQAQEDNVDRAKIQEDISQLRGQIDSVIGAAQFNGLNLVDNTRTERVLSSLDRSGGGVTASRINVLAQDMRQAGPIAGSDAERTTDIAAGTVQMAKFSGGAALDAADGTGATAADGGRQFDYSAVGAAGAGATGLNFSVNGQTFSISIDVENDEAAGSVTTRLAAAAAENTDLAKAGITVEAAGDNLQVTLGGAARLSGVDIALSGNAAYTAAPANVGDIDADFESLSLDSGTIEAGDSLSVTLGDETFTFVANERSTRDDILNDMTRMINESSQFVAQRDGNDINYVRVTGGAIAAADIEEFTGGTAGGSLSDLRTLDVANFSGLRGGADGTTAFADLDAAGQKAVIQESLDRSLQTIERMIQTSIDAAAEFGSVQKRIEIQSDFVTNLMDSMRSGIGALVDADMEETSARLQALQVQQQLGIQALTIANQQPQNILALFR